MDVPIFLIRIFLAAIFGVAGIGKLLDSAGSRKAMKEFGVPDFLAAPVAILLPFTELAISLSFLFVETSWFGAIAGSVLLLIFSCGMIYQLIRGNAPDCHCFGQIHSEPVSSKSIVRNLIFIAAAVALIVAGREDQGLNLFSREPVSYAGPDVVTVMFGIAVIGLLAAIIYFLNQISAQQAKLLRRMDVLELLVQEDIALDRDNIGHPDDGLPMGAPAFDFKLPDTAGNVIELTDLLRAKKPLLIFFVGPNCDPCRALVPEIKGWAKELPDIFEFVFISSGKAMDNLDKFSIAGIPLLLQEKREVAEEFGAVWTPTALLVNSDGRIGSRIATGDSAIRELIDKIKAADPDATDYYITNGKGELRKSKIGASVPEFQIEDLHGKEVRGDDLRGKKTLVAFWSMHCPHCVNMIDGLRSWEKTKGLDEPNLLLFSDGDAEDHADLDLASPVLLDKEYKTAAKLGMSGTPSAVLVNEKGIIVSETAIGAPQIWALIGKKK